MGFGGGDSQARLGPTPRDNLPDDAMAYYGLPISRPIVALRQVPDDFSSWGPRRKVGFWPTIIPEEIVCNGLLHRRQRHHRRRHRPPAGPTTKRKTRTEIELPSSNKKPSQPDPRWECPRPASNDDSTSEWPVTSAKLNLAPASAEEQLRHHALRLHNRALEACGGFFKGNAGSGSGSESEEEEEDCKVGDKENEEYKFLLNLFVEESGLRSYYEGNWDGGEFHCLVCGGLGKTKKIKGCVGLVHHAVSISKTKKKRAHRAFAQVVCRVLGWDFDRLPIVVLKGERLSFYLAKPGDERGESEVNAGASEAVSGAVKDNVGDEKDGNAESGEKEASNGDLMICQKSLKDDDANQCKETLNKGISEIKEEKEEAMDTRSEPELNVDQLDSALKDNVAAETDAPAEYSEKEAFDDHQCNGKEPIICQSSLKDDCTDKSIESLDEGKTVLMKEAIGEEAKDALVSISKTCKLLKSISRLKAFEILLFVFV
ncbi:uncharacterized protein LOC112168890 [Rosa chinensis]|uniref:uncharacterized protein LOC112168890 n=1 Tax=Rosa chinensis TaxID=74649 RepID=UPI001AD9383D|nr:uncharacterized protein LOC112168890 [Rosa chinensis]